LAPEIATSLIISEYMNLSGGSGGPPPEFC
jgi:hypothetical protein